MTIKIPKWICLLLLPVLSWAKQNPNTIHVNRIKMQNNNTSGYDTATFAAGCFWCVEAQFSEVKGVKSVTSGFSGGHVVDPSYEDVCTGTTGHAEACNIVYDSKIITFDELLEAFFVAHDPTQLNRQGGDIGTQYRSAIFYHNTRQKELAKYYIQKLNEENVYPHPIVTEVSPYTLFFKAENYHQDYFKNHPENAYCQMVIKPELEHFRKVFKDKLKKDRHEIR